MINVIPDYDFLTTGAMQIFTYIASHEESIYYISAKPLNITFWWLESRDYFLPVIDGVASD